MYRINSVISYKQRFYNKVVQNNFDNPDRILELLSKQKQPIDKQVLLFNLPEVLRA